MLELNVIVAVVFVDGGWFVYVEWCCIGYRIVLRKWKNVFLVFILYIIIVC